ncbi:hypothetical protein HBIAX_03747 [Achromobacter xylosoxidans]|nr:hypothetical protein HBIAX_03747 [Achromobacter xylosoxidans]
MMSPPPKRLRRFPLKGAPLGTGKAGSAAARMVWLPL